MKKISKTSKRATNNKKNGKKVKQKRENREYLTDKMLTGGQVYVNGCSIGGINETNYRLSGTTNLMVPDATEDKRKLLSIRDLEFKLGKLLLKNKISVLTDGFKGVDDDQFRIRERILHRCPPLYIQILGAGFHDFFLMGDTSVGISERYANDADHLKNSTINTNDKTYRVRIDVQQFRDREQFLKGLFAIGKASPKQLQSLLSIVTSCSHVSELHLRKYDGDTMSKQTYSRFIARKNVHDGFEEVYAQLIEKLLGYKLNFSNEFRFLMENGGSKANLRDTRLSVEDLYEIVGNESDGLHYSALVFDGFEKSFKGIVNSFDDDSTRQLGTGALFPLSPLNQVLENYTVNGRMLLGDTSNRESNERRVA